MAAGVLDAVPGDPPVPVSVWRATGPDDPPAPQESLCAGLTARLARMLLAVWTDPGEIIIDTTADPAVQAAADAGGRTYLALNLPAPHPLPDLDGRVALILLRWPPSPPPGCHPESGPAAAPAVSLDHPDPSVPEDPGSRSRHPVPHLLLSACRDLLSADGHTVVILAPPAGGVYRDYAREVIPAAREAGLGYLQHLVVISSDSQPTVPGTDRSAHRRAHVDLLVFIIRASVCTGTAGRA